MNNKQIETTISVITKYAKEWSNYIAPSYSQRDCGYAESLNHAGRMLLSILDTTYQSIPDGWEKCDRSEAHALILNDYVYELGEQQNGKLTWERYRTHDCIRYGRPHEINVFDPSNSEYTGYNPTYIRPIQPKMVEVDANELKKIIASLTSYNPDPKDYDSDTELDIIINRLNALIKE